MDSPVPHVTKIEEEDRLTCILDERLFCCPPGYTQIGNGKYYNLFSKINDLNFIKMFAMILEMKNLIQFSVFQSKSNAKF